MASSRTFGVEFEMFFQPEAIVRIVFDHPKLFPTQIKNAGDLAKEYDMPNTIESAIVNAKTFGTSEVFETDYYIILETLIKAYGFVDWKLVEDASIEGSMPIEAVTPILQGNKGLSQVAKFCMLIQRYGSVNDSTGLHVHVGADDFKRGKSAARRLTLALMHYKKFEPVFDTLMAANRRGNENQYAQSIDAQEDILKNYKQILQNDTRKLNGLLDILTKSDRYKKLNLEALQKHGTIEFRHMQGTLNPIIVTNWIQICTSFVDMIIVTESHFINLFRAIGKPPKVDPQTEKEALETLDAIKKIISSSEIKSTLVRSLEPEVGTEIIKNLGAFAENIKLKNPAYTDVTSSNKNFYYQFSIARSILDSLVGLPPDMPEGLKTKILRLLLWRIRNFLLLKFRTASVVVEPNEAYIYIDNPSYTQKAIDTKASPEEITPILTTQNKLATRTGVPRGVPSKAFSAIKQNI